MTDDEFGKLLGDDVKPIKVEKRVALDKSKAAKDISQEERKRAAENAETVDDDPLSSVPTEMLDPLDVLSFYRPGVQHGVFRNLRLGKYQIDARLDLHRMTVEQARSAVYMFIKDCLSNDVRSALITHGKGLGRETPALLKSCVAHWLPQIDEVLAFHTALKHHGGYGATYVLVKKSDKKKEETREKMMKKRS